MKKIIVLSILSLSLISCGGSNSDDESVDAFSCPLSLPIHEYRLILPESLGLPNKVAIYIDDSLKYDNCLEDPVIHDEPSIVTLLEEQESLALIKVRDFDIHNPLPSLASVRLLDRGGCTSEVEIYEKLNIELDFIDVYPHGVKCVGNKISESQL